MAETKAERAQRMLVTQTLGGKAVLELKGREYFSKLAKDGWRKRRRAEKKKF